jgi:hypothetical protein
LEQAYFRRVGSMRMSNRDAEYFADRALVELAMSRVATDPRAAAAHIEMASRYEKLAAQFVTEQPEQSRVQAA